MSAAKSSYLQLFDNESKHEDYSFLVSNLQAKVSFEDSAAGRPMEFKSAGGYHYYDPAGSASFELEARFAAVEADILTNANNPVPAQNTQAIADVQVAYQAKDAQIEASLTAEVSRASTAEQTLQNGINGLDADYKAADQTLQNSLTQETSDRASAVSAEQARAEAAEASLQNQISNILSNVDPSLIDSISELLAHVNSADQSLINTIAQLQSDHDDLKARFDELVNQS